MASETVIFELFRLRLHENGALFSPQISRRQAILDAVGIQSVLSYRDHEWRIGDVTPLDEDGIYFTFGRKSNLSIIEYDSKSRRFADSNIPNWPFSYIFLDARLGVIAISRNGKLSRETDSVANRLREMFSRYEPISAFWVIELKPIDDPVPFIDKLETAFSIKRFSFEFRRPNPFDIDEDLQKPLEEYLLEANGIGGEVQIEGDNLKASVVEHQARSAIVASAPTRALIQEEAGGPVIQISSLDNKFETREISFDADSLEDLLEGMNSVREIYQSLRLG